jgi:phosphatidylglycerophosphatase A
VSPPRRFGRSDRQRRGRDTAPYLSLRLQVNLKLWIGQGFGVGRIPVAPGTFGSLVGLLWFALLLIPANLSFFIAGTIAGFALSVWLCGAGEKILNQKDPGSVVLDEITAMPLCFAGWVGIILWKTGSMPRLDDVFSVRMWPTVLAIFLAFRFFDVVKPWPVRQSQALPGGWGVTVDDFLAAIYVNAVVLLVYAAHVIITR